MDYETSPTMKYETEPEGSAGEPTNDDDHSEKNGSTGSEVSEGFVKVDQVIDEPEERSVPEEKPLVDISPAVETIPPDTNKTNPMEAAMLDCLDPNNEGFASDKSLRDYYDQLPTETAPFSMNEFQREDSPILDANDQLKPDIAPLETQPEDGEPNGFPLGVDAPQTDSTPTLDPIPASSSLDPGFCPVGDVTEHEEEDMSDEGETKVETEVKEESPEEPVATEDLESDEKPVISEPLPEPEEEPEPVEPPKIEPPTVEEVHEEPPPPAEEEETPASDKPSCDISSFLLSRSTGGGQDEDVSAVQSKDPVVDLLYWRDVKVSAVVLSLVLLVLMSLCCFSVVSVISYLALSLLTVTISFRLYKFVLQTLNGTQQPNPFQPLLDAEITLSSEQVQKYTDSMLVHFNNCIVTTRDLVLVKNTVASLKFGILMWLLTYIGGCFNGLTLLIIDVVLAFTLPPIYEKYQEPIDCYYGKAKSKFDEVTALVRSKIPGSKPKTQ